MCGVLPLFARFVNLCHSKVGSVIFFSKRWLSFCYYTTLICKSRIFLVKVFPLNLMEVRLASFASDL